MLLSRLSFTGALFFVFLSFSLGQQFRFASGAEDSNPVTTCFTTGTITPLAGSLLVGSVSCIFSNGLPVNVTVSDDVSSVYVVSPTTVVQTTNTSLTSFQTTLVGLTTPSNLTFCVRPSATKCEWNIAEYTGTSQPAVFLPAVTRSSSTSYFHTIIPVCPRAVHTVTIAGSSDPPAITGMTNRAITTKRTSFADRTITSTSPLNVPITMPVAPQDFVLHSMHIYGLSCVMQSIPFGQTFMYDRADVFSPIVAGSINVTLLHFYKKTTILQSATVISNSTAVIETGTDLTIVQGAQISVAGAVSILPNAKLTVVVTTAEPVVEVPLATYGSLTGNFTTVNPVILQTPACAQATNGRGVITYGTRAAYMNVTMTIGGVCPTVVSTDISPGQTQTVTGSAVVTAPVIAGTLIVTGSVTFTNTSTLTSGSVVQVGGVVTVESSLVVEQGAQLSVNGTLVIASGATLTPVVTSIAPVVTITIATFTGGVSGTFTVAQAVLNAQLPAGQCATLGQPTPNYGQTALTVTVAIAVQSCSTTSSSAGGGGLSTAAIIGIAVGGGVALIALVVVIIVLVVKRRQNRKMWSDVNTKLQNVTD